MDNELSQSVINTKLSRVIIILLKILTYFKLEYYKYMPW